MFSPLGHCLVKATSIFVECTACVHMHIIKLRQRWSHKHERESERMLHV